MMLPALHSETRQPQVLEFEFAPSGVKQSPSATRRPSNPPSRTPACFSSSAESWSYDRSSSSAVAASSGTPQSTRIRDAKTSVGTDRPALPSNCSVTLSTSNPSPREDLVTRRTGSPSQFRTVVACPASPGSGRPTSSSLSKNAWIPMVLFTKSYTNLVAAAAYPPAESISKSVSQAWDAR